MQAGYWVCRALVLEQTVNNVDSIVDKIVDTFEQAVREGAKVRNIYMNISLTKLAKKLF